MYGINGTANSQVLSAIRKINSDLETSQTRIGTGKKVNAASDNASVWATAQSIRSDQKTQDSISNGISVAKGKADTAVSALDTVTDLLGQIKELAADAATDSSADYSSVAKKVAALKTQITATVNSASFQGENWLKTAAATGGTVNISSQGGSAQTVAVTTINLNAATSGTMTVFNAIAAITDASTADAVADGVDAALADIADYQATLSSFSSALGSQQDFLTALSSIRDTALSSLVDADLTAESAKVTALQTQQQLAYQALSMGNSSSQNILRLFQ